MLVVLSNDRWGDDNYYLTFPPPFLEICSTTSYIGLTASYVGRNQLPDEIVCQLSVIISV